MPESIRKEYEKIKGNYGQYKLTNAINGITSHHFNYINYKRRRRIKFQLIKTTQKGDKHYRVEFLLGKNTEMTLDRMKTFLDQDRPSISSYLLKFANYPKMGSINWTKTKNIG